MKQFIILLVALSSLFFASMENESSFIGTWKGEDKGDIKGGIGHIIFDQDGYAIFKIGEQVLGGKDFVFKGKKGSMVYEVIPNTEPIQLDFIISTSESSKKHKMLCIVEFLTNDKMKFATNFGLDTRPTEFNEKNSIILTREKE